jgi:hypothetical protein
LHTFVAPVASLWGADAAARHPYHLAENGDRTRGASFLNPTTEMIADGFTEGNEGNQELRYLCDLLFK